MPKIEFSLKTTLARLGIIGVVIGVWYYFLGWIATYWNTSMLILGGFIMLILSIVFFILAVFSTIVCGAVFKWIGE